MEKFINPNHPEIKKLASKIKHSKDPVYDSVKWVSENIYYGREKCIDLELEKNKPISLKTDYEVLKTREGICVDQSFLLASILMNLFENKKIKLVETADEESVSYYIESMGTGIELEDPFDHLCVGLVKGDELILLDPVVGAIDIEYDYINVLDADDPIVDVKFHNQRFKGMISTMKQGFAKLFSDEKNGVYLDYSAMIDENKLHRLYEHSQFGLLETWNLKPRKPEKISKEFVEMMEDSLDPVKKEDVDKSIQKSLFQQVQDRSFVDKVKKRLENYYKYEPNSFIYL